MESDPNIFLRIAASVAATAAAVYPNGIKTLLANCFSTFSIKGNPGFSNGPERLSKNPPDCPTLCNWVFDNFIIAEECVLVDNDLYAKLFSSLELQTTFGEIFKVTLAPFFIPDFNLYKLQIRQIVAFYV